MEKVKEEPSPEVLKQVACKNCGVTLEYSPLTLEKISLAVWTSIERLIVQNVLSKIRFDLALIF